MTSVDRTIEASYLSRAEVERALSASAPWGGPALRIYYLDAAARPGVVTVPAGSLADPPRKVADYINALKAAVSANGGGGGAV